MVERGRPLNILQFNTVDVNGGAARTAWNMLRLYKERGHHSWLAVGTKKTSDPDVFIIPNDAMRNAWARFWLSERHRMAPLNGRLPGMVYVNRAMLLAGEPARQIRYLRGLEGFDFPGTRRLTSLTPQKPDVLHGHNLHGGYFDLRELPALSHELPVVLTLHDAWLLSGHCAHSFDCERWKTGCGQCPNLSVYPAIPRDATTRNWQIKAAIYARSRLFVATPSRWLMEKVERSMLAPAIINARVIPNGVDLSIFRPGKQSRVRKELDIPEDAVLLLSVGNQPRSNPWRDSSTLEEAVKALAERMPGKRFILLYVGEKGNPATVGRAEIRLVETGTEPKTIAQYYQSADVFVHITKADTFPTAILEAQACGTPVIATVVGGISEQISDGDTGFLVPPDEPEVIASRIESLITEPDLSARLSERSIESARHHSDVEKQADINLNWYYSVIEQWNEKIK
jgi:glycosyltransferase involved in cell wall biosynthesis